MKITKFEYYSHDSYILTIEEESNKKEILVEYSHQDICISEGYEIYYPVDNAHQEPAQYNHYVEILKVNKIEDEDISDEMILDNNQQKIIEEYIVDLKSQDVR